MNTANYSRVYARQQLTRDFLRKVLFAMGKLHHIYIFFLCNIIYIYIYRESDIDRITSRVQVKQVKPTRKVLYHYTRGDTVNIRCPVYIPLDFCYNQ